MPFWTSCGPVAGVMAVSATRSPPRHRSCARRGYGRQCAILLMIWVTNPRQSDADWINWLKLHTWIFFQDRYFFSAKPWWLLGFQRFWKIQASYSLNAYSISPALLRSVHIVSPIKVQSSLTRVWIWVNLQWKHGKRQCFHVGVFGKRQGPPKKGTVFWWPF